MAAAAHREVGVALAVVADERDEAAVGGQRRVDLVVDDGATSAAEVVGRRQRAELERLGLVRVAHDELVELVVEHGACEVVDVAGRRR